MRRYKKYFLMILFEFSGDKMTDNKVLFNFLKKIKEVKLKCDVYQKNSYLILEKFMELIRFLYGNKTSYDKSIEENIKGYKEDDIKTLKIFVDKICKQAYIQIYIIKKLGNKYSDFEGDWITRIKELEINNIKNKFYRENIKIAKHIIQIYECFSKKDFNKSIISNKKEFVDNPFMSKIEDIYKDLVKDLVREYKYEIVFRASSKNNKTEKIETEIPSLFYKKEFIAYEKDIFHDFIAANPSEFENMTTFDKLTKMRHYEVPNRLLDVTYDPLLALYFACGNKGDNRLNEIETIMKSTEFKIENITEIINNKEKNYLGSKIVFIYIVRERYIKNFNSDTVTILSVLSKLKKEDKIILKTIVDFFKTQQRKLISINDCKELIDKINNEYMYRDEDKKIGINKKISIWLKNKNKKDNRTSKHSLFDIYEVIGKKKVIPIADKFFGGMFYGKYLLNKISKDRKVQIEECIRKSGKQDVSISELLFYFTHNDTMLEIIFKCFNIPELLEDKFYSNLDEEDIKQIYYEKKLMINKNTRVFTINELFNFFVSSCVSELNWQLKQEIPGWYENVLDLETFTHCYLVKPKMNNPRIVAQSGAFFIYPFKDTNIVDSLLNNEKFNIDTEEDVEKLNEELKILNIKETKYMPDDLAKYAKEIKEKYER